MEVTPKTRLQVRLQNIIFVVLFLTVIGLLAWLGQRYNYEADWTATGRNTLSEATIKLLQRIPDPVEIIAFARESNLVPTRKNIEELISRYQKHKSDIHIRYINPDTEPDKTREYQITVDGELVVSYQNRSEHIQRLSEESLTNTLQRLLRSGEKHIVFLAGHGERKPQGKANHDYGKFIEHLQSKGIKASTLILNDSPKIPDDTAALVIAGPQLDYLPGEVKLIQNYLARGGNLLWLHDPGKLYGLQPLLKTLGLSFVKGTIVDPTTQLLGISDPSFALVANYDYASHPITRDFNFMTIFPRAVGIKIVDKKAYHATPFLQTVPRSWSETAKLEGVIDFNDGKDIAGPLNIGIALTRGLNNGKRDKKEKNDEEADKPLATQRIVVLGDGDFLSNAYLGNQGNQDLGYNIINWLNHDDTFIDIPIQTSPDTELMLESTTWSVLGLLFLFGLPLLLLGYGIFIWWKRRKP